MTLRDAITRHYETQNEIDEFHTFKYHHTDGHQALIREIQALNIDKTFQFTVQLTPDHSIVYSYHGAKHIETSTVSEVIRYLDDLKRTLTELDQADKLGHIAKVEDEDSEEFFIDLLERGKQIYINVDNCI